MPDLKIDKIYKMGTTDWIPLIDAMGYLSPMPHLVVLQGKIPPAARQRPAGCLFRATRPVSSHMDSTAPGIISGKSICADGPTGT